MATVTVDTPTHCARCGQPFPPRWTKGCWQRYCSQSCGQQARFGKRDAAIAVWGMADPRAWLLAALNRGTMHRALADQLDMDKQALAAWLRALGIRKVVRYE